MVLKVYSVATAGEGTVYTRKHTHRNFRLSTEFLILQRADVYWFGNVSYTTWYCQEEGMVQKVQFTL